MLTPAKDDVIYASVLADGKIHVTVKEETPGAVKREYETSDKKKGVKYELVYSDLIGKITKVSFYEGDYGRQLQVTVTDGDEKPVVLSLSTSSNYGEDLMKKLMNVDLKKTVKIVPYSFVDDNKKNKKGITIWQDNGKGENVKIGNYFYDPVKKQNINEYPEPKKQKKPLSKDQWKLYFGECREFLVEQITEHFKIEVSEDKDGLDDFPSSEE